MKIKRNTNTNATNFKYISVGTVFKNLDANFDTDLYMRIVNIEDYDSVINAIALDSGEATYFSDDESVIVIDGEFVTHE